VKQWTDIINDRENKFQDKPAVGCFDAGYSNPRSIYTFFESMKNKDNRAVFIARLRTNRFLMRPSKKLNVKIQVWSDLRMRSHNDCPIAKVPLTVVRIFVSNKDGAAMYKHPLWLVIVGEWPANWPVTFYGNFTHQDLILSTFLNL